MLNYHAQNDPKWPNKWVAQINWAVSKVFQIPAVESEWVPTPELKRVSPFHCVVCKSQKYFIVPFHISEYFFEAPLLIPGISPFRVGVIIRSGGSIPRQLSVCFLSTVSQDASVRLKKQSGIWSLFLEGLIKQDKVN